MTGDKIRSSQRSKAQRLQSGKILNKNLPKFLKGFENEYRNTYKETHFTPLAKLHHVTANVLLAFISASAYLNFLCRD